MSLLDDLNCMLCPPGEGIYTVHTAREKREHLQKQLYQDKPVREAWLAHLGFLAEEKLAVLGVPSDCGGGIQRGANWGPLFIREAVLRDGHWPLLDLGDVRVIPHLLHDKYLNAETIASCRKALYGEGKDYPVSPLSIAERALTEIYSAHPELRVLAYGGDHSVSYPLVRAWAKTRRTRKLGLLHFDAHTDLLDQRLGIDYNFGTWAYHAREFFPTPDQLIQVGIRSTGKERSHWEKNLQVTQHWASEIKSKGMPFYTAEVIKQFKRAGVEEVYISFDIDALDRKWVAATGTPEDNGLDPVACGDMIRAVAQEFKVTGTDLVEVAPFVNHDFFPNNSQETSLMTCASIARFLARAMGADA